MTSPELPTAVYFLVASPEPAPIFHNGLNYGLIVSLLIRAVSQLHLPQSPAPSLWGDEILINTLDGRCLFWQKEVEGWQLELGTKLPTPRGTANQPRILIQSPLSAFKEEGDLYAA